MVRNQSIMVCLLEDVHIKEMAKLELTPEQCLISSSGMKIRDDKEWYTLSLVHHLPTDVPEDELP